MFKPGIPEILLGVISMAKLRTYFLFVDDDEDDADLFCEALAEVNTQLKCTTIDRSDQVIPFLESKPQEQPDIIFLDINMPIMTGWDVLRQLRAKLEFDAIPVIMYSTSSATRDVKTAYQLGALAFLSKSESFTELCDILRTVATTSDDDLLAGLSRFPSFRANPVG